MHTTGNIGNNIVRGKRGGNRRGFRWDKNSPEYREYRRKYAESMSKKARRNLETLAKAPLPGRAYEPNKGKRYK